MTYLVTNPTPENDYLGGNRIFLAWLSKDIRRICLSRDVLTRACPASADAVRLVLSVIGYAPDLRAVARLRSIEVVPLDPTSGRVVIEHEEVAMQAAVLAQSGRVIQSDAERFWIAASAESTLRVDDIHAAGASLLRSVG